MAKYVSLIMFTETGIKNLRKTTARAKAFEEKMVEKGISITSTLWTVGKYDIIHFFEAADDETAAIFTYTLSSMGNVKAHTMRAYDANDMEKIIGKIQTPFDLIK